MSDGNQDGQWVVYLIIAIFVFILPSIWLVERYDFADACPANEANEVARCFREWVGALSGWAATIAAALTIVFLHRQNAEQKKQTDFLLGDALPTIDVALDLDDPELLVTRIVNWNRRGLFIHELTVDGLDDITWGIFEAKINGTAVNNFENRRYIRGREDRSRAPEVIQFKIGASKGNKMISKWPKSTCISAGIHIFSEKPIRRKISCRLYHDDKNI